MLPRTARQGNPQSQKQNGAPFAFNDRAIGALVALAGRYGVPVHVAAMVAMHAYEEGMPATSVTAGLQAASELARQRKHRCAACFRWLERGKHDMLPIIAIHNREFVIAVVCERCERRWPGDELIERLRPYLCEEGVQE